MSLDPDFLEYVRDLLAGVGEVRVKRMFGGAGLYAGDLFFALVMDDVLYLKADDETRAAFEAAGSKPFVFEERDGRRVETSYWTMPESALDDPDEAARWSRLAVEAALRKAARKKRR